MIHNSQKVVVKQPRCPSTDGPTHTLCTPSTVDYAGAESLQSRVALGDPMDSSPPGSSVKGFSRQEYWSGLPLPSPVDHPNQGLNPDLPHCRQTLYRLSHQGSSLFEKVISGNRSTDGGEKSQEGKGTTRRHHQTDCCYVTTVIASTLTRFLK